MNKNNVSVAQIANLDSSGMCYVIHLIDGTFIIIDGGEADALGEGIYDFNSCALKKCLEKMSCGTKPVISAWFITHFHLDHVDLATRFIKEMGDSLEIKAFFYNDLSNYEEIDDYFLEKILSDKAKNTPEDEMEIVDGEEDVEVEQKNDE